MTNTRLHLGYVQVKPARIQKITPNSSSQTFKAINQSVAVGTKPCISNTITFRGEEETYLTFNASQWNQNQKKKGFVPTAAVCAFLQHQM